MLIHTNPRFYAKWCQLTCPASLVQVNPGKIQDAVVLLKVPTDMCASLSGEIPCDCSHRQTMRLWGWLRGGGFINQAWQLLMGGASGRAGSAKAGECHSWCIIILTDGCNTWQKIKLDVDESDKRDCKRMRVPKGLAVVVAVEILSINRRVARFSGGQNGGERGLERSPVVGLGGRPLCNW